MGRITPEDLAALRHTEQDILSLPSTAPVVDHEPLEQSREFQYVEAGHSHKAVLFIKTCEGEGILCEHHADEVLAGYFNERHLRANGQESELTVCPDCGKKSIDCLSIIGMDQAWWEGR